MIIVTGGAGMIGSNIVKALNESGINDILVVDNLKNGKKFENLVDLDITDYMDRDDFLVQLMSGEEFGPIDAIFHQGACSDTTETDGKFMMLNNYEYSKELLHYCLERQIPFLYASSAAIYGDRSDNFIEEKQFESALNVYGYSKQQFDNYVRRLWEDAEAHGETLSQITALRYFSVYGPREQHKGEQASLPFQLNQQLNAGNAPTIVAGSEHFKRDFVHVSDVVAVNLWFLQNGISGIYNVGTGQAESLGDMTKAVVQSHGKSEIEAIDDPALLKEAYPEFTQADLTKLRAAGCQHQFKSVAEGIAEYMPMINK